MFEGYVLIPENGKYTFKLNTNAKAFLRVHDIALIDGDYDYKKDSKNSATLNLEKGYHHIKLYVKQPVKRKTKLSLQMGKNGSEFSDISKIMYAN